MVQFAGWWVNVQCCFYHFWSYQMRRRPNSPFGRGVFCDGLLAVTIWHRWIPLVKPLLLSEKSSKIKKIIFLRISQKFLFEKKLFDERNPTV
jgi:hypothetical protein